MLIKPLSIKFFKDSEDPTKNQLLVNPNASYNLYDGPSFGGRFHNKTLQEMAFHKPKNHFDFKKINGVGGTKIKYIDDFLTVIIEFLG